VARWSSG